MRFIIKTGLGSFVKDILISLGRKILLHPHTNTHQKVMYAVIAESFECECIELRVCLSEMMSMGNQGVINGILTFFTCF